ncbi:MAG: RidA family protein [Chloroflexi bacterium]|jgi:enamine deaminase RidA (YjgF/YER057c/UK114 family)|nr:RidA family protein [Chloroflexota bacterium]
MKRHLNPDRLFNSLQYGFSQVVAAQGRTTVYISGQVAWDEKGAIVGRGDLAVQTRKALENVATAVAAAGGTLADVVSMRIYVVAGYMRDSRAIREALLDFFPTNPPATTWIAVPALANEEFLVEIEPIAVLDD